MKPLSKYGMDKKRREEYALNVEDLMEIVSQANPFEQKNHRGRPEKWVIGEYSVRIKFRNVCIIGAFDKEKYWFHLRPKDYDNFVQACLERREFLAQERKKSK